MPEIELTGNRLASVNGCRGILEYTDTAVRINTQSMILCFNGNNLRIKFLSENTIEIAGVISKLEFVY